MGKQTMGFPVHALDRRADNKLYKLQTPQSPVVRPVMYDHYEMDTYPLGTNAIVAVMSYTVSTTLVHVFGHIVHVECICILWISKIWTCLSEDTFLLLKMQNYFF